MSKIPGLYGDIGKNARDILYKDYTQQPAVHFHSPSFDWSFDVSCKVAEVVPGLNTLFRLIIPDFSKAELQYLHGYFGITTGIGMKANSFGGLDPFVNFSGVIGNTLLSVGADVALDIPSKTINKFNAGLSFNSDFLIASLTLNERLDTVKASLYHPFNPLTRTALAAELKHSFTNNGTTTVSLGAQHGLFPFTLLKARVNSDGMVGAVVQQEFLRKFYLAIAGEMDLSCVSRTPKIGISMALRP